MAKIGLQLYTVREYLKTAEDVEKTLQRVYDMGYRTLQISGLKDFEDEKIIHAFARCQKKFSFDICATHIPFSLLENKFEYVVQMHKMWNCAYVGIGSIDKEIRDHQTIQGYLNFAEKLEKYALELKKAGLHLIYHNHEFEFVKINQKILFDILIENCPNVLFELDVHWLQRAGMDIVKMLRRLKGRMDVIHLKDYRIYHPGNSLRSEIRYAEIGEGNLDFTTIIECATECQARFMLIEQDDTYERDVFESAEISYQNLVKLGFKALLEA